MPGFWTLHIVGWFAFAVAMVLSRIGVFPIAYMVVAKGAYALIGAIVALGLRVIYQRVLARERPITSLLMIGVVASYCAAIIWTATSNYVTLSFIDPLFRDGESVAVNLRRLTNGSLYDAFILLAWSLLYFGIKWQTALVAERERVLRAESMANEARLEALRYQINPHFLFNALNGVSALVLEQRTQQAADMLSRLAAFLRMTLESGRTTEVALDDELLFLRAYLAIEQARFGDRLQLSFDIDTEARRALVPVLLLQPLVENSVRHVIARSVDGGRIAIDANVAGDVVSVSITDQCEASRNDADSGIDAESLGIGLTNTRERLAALYGAGATLTFERLQPTGARVVIRLPYRRSTDHRA
jgi:LytS/YehU family sensor histidine kinase